MLTDKVLRLGSYVASDKVWHTVDFEDGYGSTLRIFDTRTWITPRGTQRNEEAAVRFALGFKSAHSLKDEIEIMTEDNHRLDDEAFNDGMRAAKVAN